VKPIRDSRLCRCLVVLSMLMWAASFAWAQGPGRKVTVTTKTGQTIEGTFVAADQRDVVLQADGRRLTLPVDEVALISFVGGSQPAAGVRSVGGGQQAAGVPNVGGRQPAAGVPNVGGGQQVAVGALSPAAEDAFRAFSELQAATDKGVRREQYPDLLSRTVPRVEAFVKSPGNSFADVRLLMAAAVRDYLAPFGTGMLITSTKLWTTSSPMWRDATVKVAHARELASQPGEESHREDPAERDLSTSAQVSGRLGSGDRLMPEALVRSTAGAFNDVYRLTLDRPMKLTFALDTHECGAYLTLTDEAGEVIAGSGGARGATRITKDLKPGVYHVWAGAQRPDEVGTYQLTVSGR
jgi:hypothetical protein